MPVILKNQGGTEAIQRVSFSNEAELHKLLADNPSLLQNEAEPSLAFVKREVNLGSSGFLDLLLINSDGLPIAVEVKLQKNAESRREVVAQAIDYITVLTDKTVDDSTRKRAPNYLKQLEVSMKVTSSLSVDGEQSVLTYEQASPDLSWQLTAQILVWNGCFVFWPKSRN
jgi:hypothetical protein